MSWTVNGTTYHSHAEYQAACHARDQSRSSAETLSALAEVARVTAQIVNRERELASARNDLAAQVRINAALREDVAALHRVQASLQEAQARTERQMQQSFAAVRSQLDCQQAGIEANRMATAENAERLRELDDKQREHERAVRAEFARTRARIEDGLAQADRKLHETEQRLGRRIQEVDTQLQAERQARLAKEATGRSRARLAADLAQEALDELAGDVDMLGLDEERGKVRARIGLARQLVDQGDEAAGVSTAMGAWTDATGLGHTMQRRRAALEARRDAALDRLARIRRSTDDRLVQAFFEVEHGRLSAICGMIEGEVRQGYVRHDRREVEAERYERLLCQLEGEAAAMVATAPGLADLARDRAARARVLTDVLCRVYGPLVEVKSGQSVPEDRKSPLLVECTFSGAHVDLSLDIDGAYTIDGHGHPTNTTCGARGEAVLSELQGVTTVAETRTESTNRAGPIAPSRPAVPSAWAQVAQRLDDLRRKL